MGWNYPDILFEEMVKLIKGFVDILILASGYQSSGLQAHWDVNNIKNALHWGLFFENVFRHLSNTDVYLESVEELDATLAEMTSNPSFPQGLSHISSATLSRARAFVSEHLLRALPLRDSHLRAFLRATIEMDLDLLSETDYHCLNLYLNKLTLMDFSLNLVPESRVSVKKPIILSSDIAPTMKNDTCTGDDFTKFAVEGFLKRQSAVSCISTVKTGLDILSSVIKHINLTDSDNSLIEEHLKRDGNPAVMGSVDDSVDYVTWNQRKSKNLLYFLNMRTIRLVSGASMILSAPTVQWVQLFQRLHISEQGNDDDLSEILELLLLGCIVNRWSCLIEHFMSVSYDSLTISKQYHVLCKGKSQCFDSKEEIVNLKESCILEYLAGFLSGQLHHLWKLSPALIAVAVPSWSPLFRLYLSEIEIQFKGESSAMRCCSCYQDGKDHKDCELAERIWCLYIFHICGSHLMHGAINA
ncbi:hypothetical protein LWI28_006878 [Acer negundo]|uniref:Uncharacterized protein n=1 Tax=Acer negundo TaxID=4023 RepID=A0AAD5IZL4_ACENE|nr:hypothetical protein LWI28_006878 [Acer negundo]